MYISHDHLKTLPVFGIAGNFAEHLSQAGEDADFVNIQTEDENAPKGMFPIYIPNHPSFLGTYPLSNQTVEADFSAPINLHMEPEVCVLFDVQYQDNQVSTLTAKAFSAFNDCSIRRPNATKISQKKNWGHECTGISEQWIEIDQFAEGGVLDNYHIASFLKRKGEIIEYGIDSPVMGYNYFYQKLTDWIIQTLNQQNDFGPLEDLAAFLKDLKQPQQIVVSLGATRYTPFGETGFLQADDQIGIFVYDSTQLKEIDVQSFFSDSHDDAFESGTALIQSIKPQR